MPDREELRASLERLSDVELLAMIGPVWSHGYTEEGLAVAREVLVERGVDTADAQRVTCPGCRLELDAEQGSIESRTGCLAFLFVGMGYQPSWFTSHATGAKEIVLRPRFSRAALKCRNCGLIMFGSRHR